MGPKSPMWRGNYKRKRHARACPTKLCHKLCKKWLNQPICHLGCELGWAEERTSWIIFARWRQCAHMGGHIGTTWRIQLNSPFAAAMQPYVKLLWALAYFCTANGGLWQMMNFGFPKRKLNLNPNENKSENLSDFGFAKNCQNARRFGFKLSHP